MKNAMFRATPFVINDFLPFFALIAALFEPINKDQGDVRVRTPLNTMKRFSFQ